MAVAGKWSWLVCLLAGMSLAFVAVAQVPSPQAREQMLGLLEREALHRDQVDWKKLRTDLAATSDVARQQALLADAIRRATAGHGRWLSAEQAAAANKANSTSARPTTDQPVPVLPKRSPRLGLVNVGPYLTDRSLPQPERVARDRQWAQGIQAQIREQDDGHHCGWIVDLRGNSGGNMWPMLLGVGPLLHDGVDETKPVGNFDAGNGLQAWGYRNSAVWIDDQPRIGLGTKAHVLKRPGAPVAVLQSGRTASSGEAIVLAFRGRRDSRSFGYPTAGYSTGNTPVQLLDGSLLLLTGSVMKDRNGMGDGSRIHPDVPANDDAEMLRLAERWLLAQLACTGAPEGSVPARPAINVSR